MVSSWAAVQSFYPRPFIPFIWLHVSQWYQLWLRFDDHSKTCKFIRQRVMYVKDPNMNTEHSRAPLVYIGKKLLWPPFVCLYSSICAVSGGSEIFLSSIIAAIHNSCTHQWTAWAYSARVEHTTHLYRVRPQRNMYSRCARAVHNAQHLHTSCAQSILHV